MTLQTFPDLIQGSEEWLTLRRGMVTASVVGQLITPKTIKPASNAEGRALTATLVAERITGWTDDNYVSFDMELGHINEALARDLYTKTYAPVTESGFMVNDDSGWRIGYSPDGLVGDDGLIEVKSRLPKKHLATILADEVDAEFMAQIQCGLLVSGREWCDFISYCGGMPMWPKRVLPDDRWQYAILRAVDALEHAAEHMIADYRAAVAGLPATERTDYSMEMTF